MESCECAVHPSLHLYGCICFFDACVFTCLHSRHPVCEFSKLFTALAVSIHCWWQMESMSHCGSASLEIQFSTFPLKIVPWSCLITRFWDLAPESHWMVCHCFPINAYSSMCFRSAEELMICSGFEVGWQADKLLFTAHLLRAPTIIVPNIHVLLCTFHFRSCPHSSLLFWLELTPLPALHTSSPVSLHAGEKCLCVVYWIFRPPGAFWQTLTLLSLCFSLTRSLASVQEVWGSSTGLTGITMKAVSLCLQSHAFDQYKLYRLQLLLAVVLKSGINIQGNLYLTSLRTTPFIKIIENIIWVYVNFILRTP